MKKLILLVSCFTVTAIAVLSNLNSTNANSMSPNDGNAGAPADNAGQTCTGCHGGTATQTTGVISSDIPGSGYIGGATYNFSVTMSGSAAYGFEMTPQTATSNVGLGTWIAGTGSAVSNKYIKQSIKKTGTSAVWAFQWTAPLTATTVTIYGSFNYANNNGSSSGDIIKKSSVTYFASTTGIKENYISNSLLSVFPNPTTETLYVMSNEQFNQGTIYSIDGKLVKTISEQELLSKTISVTDLEHGLYYLQVSSEGKNLNAKFLKK